MSNVNPIILLRDKAIIWIALALGALGACWWVYGFFTAENADTISTIDTLSASLSLIQKEGVVTEKNWNELTTDEKKNEQWSTMTQLVPSLGKLAGSGTAAAAKNISTMKDISFKVGNEDYIPWLTKSWTADADAALTKTQSDIAEVIPVFSGIAEMTSTQDIAGKITLKTLNDYIQANIVDQFNLTNAFGEIGIDQVQFLPEAPEIGMYDIPLHFEKVPNENVLSLLQFLGKTGGVNITENGKNVTIEHINPEPLKSTDPSLSSLKNLLITVEDMTITPTKIDKDPSPANIVTSDHSLWDVNITLRFYIRGVSRDHIAALDTKLSTLLDTGTNAGSLIMKGNTLLKTCNGCSDAPQIRDIINLLMQARAAYDSIILAERDPKKSSNTAPTS